jgi:3-polyprenyl-4-hydroxybenzoate decarboxylase
LPIAFLIQEEKMEYQDLRDWIQIAEEMGELKTLKNCDWNLEIGAITELVHHKEDGPAVLFDEIKGYPKGIEFYPTPSHQESAWP